MYKILIAKHSGFCFGVKRAINIIEEVQNKYRGEKIYTLGPIIHNPQTVEKLKKEGIEVLDDINKIDKGVIILRTHGVERQVLDKLKKKNLIIIDATCPFVRKAQEYVKKLNNDKFPVIIIGEPEHPEVKALKSQIDSKVFVIKSEHNMEFIKHINDDKIGVVTQTTQDYNNFKTIIIKLLDYFKEVHIYNTICNATELRQKAAIQLAKKVDLMFIIGGYNSGNTKRLYSLCKNILNRTYHIETKNDIEDSMFDNGIKQIGIAAGASTPDWLVEDVINYIKEINKGGQNND